MPLKFPIFNLPWFIIKDVLSNSSTIDLIELSFCSRKCKSLVSTLEVAFDQIDLKIENYNTFIVKLKNDVEIFLYWSMSTNSLCGPKVFRKINKLKIRFCKPQMPTYPYSLLTRSPLKSISLTFKEISQFLIDTFPRCTVNLEIVPDGLQNILMPRINRYHNFTHKLTGHIPNDDLKALLENVVITGDMLIRTLISPHFQCPSVRLHCNKWEMYGNAHWITREMLLSSHCSEITLSNAINLKPVDFLDFVENWKRSSDKKLRFAIFRTIGGKFPIEPLDLEHLEPMKWDPEVRGKSYPYMQGYAADLSDGIDICRSDGLIATIKRTYASLEFYIWHDRFPNVDGLHFH